MKKYGIFLAIAMLASTAVFAQEGILKLPKYKFGFGLKGGVNIANMRYTFDEFADYENSFLVKPQFGIFADFPIVPQFSIGGEFDYYGRGVEMKKYVDENYGNVDYRIDAQYFDIRMPLVYSFKPRYMFTPYVVLAPGLGIAKGGTMSYKSDIIAGEDDNGVEYCEDLKLNLTKKNFRSLDFNLFLGAGINYPIPLANGNRLNIGLEAGYNWGFINTFSKDELDENPTLAIAEPNTTGSVNVDNILYQGVTNQGGRYNRGIEVTLRVGLALFDGPKTHKTTNPQPIIVEKTDTVVDTVVKYVHKECYTLDELADMLEHGKNIADKRACIFDMKFEFDSDKLKNESKPILDKVYKMLKADSDLRIQINGHTDSIGTDQYNQNLSERRAKSAANYLVNKGISRYRITCTGYGEDYPIDTNATEKGRARNRRVEIEFRKQK